MTKKAGLVESLILIVFAIVLFSSLSNVFASSNFSSSLNAILLVILWGAVILMIIGVIIKIVDKAKRL